MVKSNLKQGIDGSILLEALIAITITTVGLLGMFALLSKSLGLTRVISDRYIAGSLGSEGIEIVKNIIDTNILTASSTPWNKGLTPGAYEVAYNSMNLLPASGKPLRFDAASGLYNYGVGNETTFQRKLLIDWPSPNEIKANVFVTWVSRGGVIGELNVEDHFFNWR